MCIRKAQAMMAKEQAIKIWNEKSLGGADAKGFLYREGELGRSVGRANSARYDSWPCAR